MKYFYKILITAALVFFPFFASATTVVFTSSGTWTAPVGVTSVLVKAWAGGGGGSHIPSTGSVSGGAGGGFAQKNSVTVVPGTNYTVTVGVGGTAAGSAQSVGGDGTDSWFSTSGTVFAQHGQGGQIATGSSGAGSMAPQSLGGQTTSEIGDVLHNGGNGTKAAGGNGDITGAGGGAGDSADGSNSVDNGSGIGASGGSVGGGIGGNSANTNTANQATAGSTIGAGGGSQRSGTNTLGVGARGEVDITYTAAVPVTSTPSEIIFFQ